MVCIEWKWRWCLFCFVPAFTQQQLTREIYLKSVWNCHLCIKYHVESMNESQAIAHNSDRMTIKEEGKTIIVRISCFNFYQRTTQTREKEEFVVWRSLKIVCLYTFFLFSVPTASTIHHHLLLLSNSHQHHPPPPRHHTLFLHSIPKPFSVVLCHQWNLVQVQRIIPHGCK